MIGFRSWAAVLLGAFTLHAGATASHALIGTADIANNAVTTPKLRNLAVTNPKIANNAVTAAKIANSAVTAAKIANSAVTPRKISANGNVIVVAPAGGDFTNPAAAVASITTASESNPYLVKVMPGRYNVGDASVIMKPFVDLEGSGESVTSIEGTVSTPLAPADPNDSRPLYGVVTMAEDSEVRFLSVVNRGAFPDKCVAAVLSRDTTGRLSHVTGIAEGAGCNIGVAVSRTGGDDVVLLRDVHGFGDGGVVSVGIGVRGAIAEVSAALVNCIADASGASHTNVGLLVMNAAPVVMGGVLMAEGGSATTLALSGLYGLPTLQGVLAMGAMSFTGNEGAAVLSQSAAGTVTVANGAVDIFNSTLWGPVIVTDDGVNFTPVTRCAGTVRSDTLQTLDADCSTPDVP